MNVNELLDTIEDTLDESASMPLSGGKRLVDVAQIQEYLDEIRANLPGELRQAQQIVNERARILTSDAEIVKAAQQRAAEISSSTQAEMRALRQKVTDYCDNMLRNTEEVMAENAAQVKNVRANLRQNGKKNG